MEMSRDPATGHRHHNPEKARTELYRADQSHLVMIRQIRPALIGWNLETISWQLPGRPARPHHTITKIFYMLHHHRSSAYRSLCRVGLAFNPWDCNNNPAQYWPVCPGVTCVQVFTWWGPGQAVLVSECSELPQSLIIAPCPVIVRLCWARLLS